MKHSNRHWIENLSYSIEVFDKPHGSLVEVLAPCSDLDMARAVYAVAARLLQTLRTEQPEFSSTCTVRQNADIGMRDVRRLHPHRPRVPGDRWVSLGMQLTPQSLMLIGAALALAALLLWAGDSDACQKLPEKFIVLRLKAQILRRSDEDV